MGTHTTTSYAEINNEVKEVSIQEYAKEKVALKWSEGEWESFNYIITAESGWDHLAQNPYSSAFGLGQFLTDTWGSVGCIKTNDPNIQIECTIKYIEQRYGTPTNAKYFHLQNNWY